MALASLTARALAALPAEAMPPRPLSAALTRVLAEIEAGMNGELSVAGLAERAGLSGPTLTRLTRAELGMSPRELLRARRVERARRMLWESDALIDDVAEACGFGDRFHFSKMFKACEGVSPGAYRDRGRGVAGG